MNLFLQRDHKQNVDHKGGGGVQKIRNPNLPKKSAKKFQTKKIIDRGGVRVLTLTLLTCISKDSFTH